MGSRRIDRSKNIEETQFEWLEIGRPIAVLLPFDL
jgi:hypothetical protein